jgi:GST-like protein
MFLEEAGLPYTIVPVNIGKGEQFTPGFLRISPNNRMPAIIDTDPAEPGPAVSVFESGCILVYLAEKTGKFLPRDLRGRFEALQWVFWQMAGLGPMAGQNHHHFSAYAPEKIPYAIERYQKETSRLYAVLDKQLADHEFIAGAYSIADMASYPWIVPYERQGQKLEDYPHLKRWFEAVRGRPAVKRAYEKGKPFESVSSMGDDAKKILFGQSAATVRGGR